MTVAELIAQLQTLDQALPVVSYAHDYGYDSFVIVEEVDRARMKNHGYMNRHLLDEDVPPPPVAICIR